MPYPAREQAHRLKLPRVAGPRRHQGGPSVRSWTAVQEYCLRDCAELTNSIYEGLGLRIEIEAVAAQALGETIILETGGRIDAFAVCHWGPGSEADSGECYAKFAAARPGAGAADRLGRLIEAIDAVTVDNGLARSFVGVNTARHQAYQALLQRGYRTRLQGVTMHKPNEAGYDREDVFLLDDWR